MTSPLDKLNPSKVRALVEKCEYENVALTVDMDGHLQFTNGCCISRDILRDKLKAITKNCGMKLEYVYTFMPMNHGILTETYLVRS
jgi:hypothetical protein